MTTSTYTAWADVTAETKQTYRKLHATFVMAPRTMSRTRLVDLVKRLLEKGNVVFGIADEDYVAGFENQAQFRTLRLSDISSLADKIASAGLPHTFLTLSYPQAVVDDVIRALRPSNVVLVRGSWQFAFQHRSTYALLQRREISFEFVSPFVHDTEAREYLASVTAELPLVFEPVVGEKQTMLGIADQVAKASFDYSFQTGAVLAEETEQGYTLVDAACNEVVPYQTYALHFGNSREENLAAVHDANHYDTIHAEQNLLVRAMQSGHTFEGKSLFINLLPCPACARILTKTGLKEVVYKTDHSDGYAVTLFDIAGIQTRKE